MDKIKFEHLLTLSEVKYKINYGKFGDLLAEVKAVTGGKDE